MSIGEGKEVSNDAAASPATCVDFLRSLRIWTAHKTITTVKPVRKIIPTRSLMPFTSRLPFTRFPLRCSSRSWLILFQPLQHRRYDQRQSYRGVHEHFAEAAALCGRNELPPRDRLAVRTA